MENYLVVLIIILLTFIFSKILFYIFKTYFKYYARKSKLGDAIVNVVSGPLVWFFIIIGFYYATAILHFPGPLQIFFNHITTLAVTAVILYFLLRLGDVLITYSIEPYIKATESKLDDQLLPLFRKTIKVVTILLGVVLTLNNLGYNISSLLAGLGIGGLAIALAAQETIGNVFGSVSIFADKVFEVGDAVKIGEIRGTVKEVGIRSTRIETADGTLLAIPNAKIAVERIENLTQIGIKRVTMTLGLPYEISTKNMEKAIRVMKKILGDSVLEGEIKDDFVVYFMNFGVYTLDLQVIYSIPTVKYPEYAPIIHRINMQIKEQFDKNKIEFAFPTQTLYVKKGKVK